MKKIITGIAAAVACVAVLSLSACGGGESKEQEPAEPQTYTVQYTDGTGIHSFDVEYGKLYSISDIPQKNGYEFTGLFDAETGGTQYINAGGSSVSEFKDKKNLVLYPQFKAKEYTLALDYGGAAVTGERSIKVSYGTEIADLPFTLTLENKTFTGWYTQENRGGVQIADGYGMIPSKNIVDEHTFDLSDPRGFIYLYAGFKGVEYDVSLYVTDSGSPEEIKVEHGTPISNVLPETRKDGKAVIAWSKKKNDTLKEQIFDGKVTGEMILYAAEYAPVIDFEPNGGKPVRSLIARAGDEISLPVPTRENYKFMGWQTSGGVAFTHTSMPEDSAKLFAKWQAMIVFDTNGGTEVENISEPKGTGITLPQTEKSGYIFAGWYDGSGNKYENAAMPETSIKLVAKYAKIKKDVFVLVDRTNTIQYDNTDPSISTACDVLDLSSQYNAGVRKINVRVHYKVWRNNSNAQTTTQMTWYSTATASYLYELWYYQERHERLDVPQNIDREKTLTLSGPKLYICRWTGQHSGWARITDYYIEIEYPDMTTLY